MSTVTEISKTRTKKWCLNPRGKAWSEDPNKFGQKMLEKMGWSRGKGLGAKEDGVIEHLRVSYKNDTHGMGFKEKDGQWTEHDSNFNALLQTLSGEKHTDEINITSLEKKSETSRVRVHYKKFTRGKDLSRCSEKDLANIFGKKTLKSTPATKITTEQAEQETYGNFARNSGSMVDYFKRKLPNFAKPASPMAVGNAGSESEEESRVGFGFLTPKKRKLSEENVEGTPKKVKSEEEDKIGLSNPAFDPLFNGVEVQKHVLNTIEEEEEEVDKCRTNGKLNGKKKERVSSDIQKSESTKKKKKNKDNGITPLENGNFEDSLGVEEEVKSEDRSVDSLSRLGATEVKKKKKKIKEKTLAAVENPNFKDEAVDGYVNSEYEVKRKKDNDSCQDSVLSDNFEVMRKKKKKKSIENNSMALINPVFNGDSSETCYVNENFEVPRKKKKNNLAVDNPSFNEEISKDATFNCEYEVKRKKKKRKNSSAIDNPTFNDSIDQNEDGDGESSTARATTKNDSIKDSSTVVDNEPQFDLMLNVTSTPSQLQTSKSNSLHSSTVKRRKSVRFSDFNEERIIPNNEDMALRNELFDINTKVITNGLKTVTEGNSNPGFSISNAMLEESIDQLSQKIDHFQVEIENDMNESKVVRNGPRYVGTVGRPDGENEKIPGGTVLRFKYAKFGRTPPWARRPAPTAKQGYKHLIKGDIVVAFNNTNLHEIGGYGVNVDRQIK